MITYKGYNINVDYEPSSPKNCCYVAYICDSNGHHEHTRGESKEDAIKFLQQKIDNYKVFNELYLKPLDSNELQQLKEYFLKEYFSSVYWPHLHLVPKILIRATVIYSRTRPLPTI